LPGEDPVPTTCPTDTAHTLDTTLTSVIDTITENKVTIREESTETGGNFQSRSVTIVSDPGQTNTTLISWPYPVSAMAMEFNVSSDMKGDAVGLAVGVNTIIGALTANSPATSAWTAQNYTSGQIVSYTHPTHGSRYYTCLTDTVSNEPPTDTTHWRHGYRLNVSGTVVANTMTGYYLNLFDGVNSDDLGRVLGVDTENSRVYVEEAPTNSFLATSPSYVRQTVYMLKDWTLGAGGSHLIGESKIGGSYIPADVVVTAFYTNNGEVQRTFIGSVEYLY
jgi:hypothetical protein